MTEEYFKKEFAYMFQVDKREPISLFGFETSDGWNNLLFNLFCIVSIIDKDKCVRVVQVKEKFGGLRFYFEWVGQPRKKTLHDRYVDLANKLPQRIRKLLGYPYRKMDKTYSQIYDIVSLFESVSYRVCEQCGEPATKRNRSKGWISTFCDKCWDELESAKALRDATRNEQLLCSGHLQPEDL